ncbi:MAG: apolipoprotein N-acyltransferase [Thermodesulfobacteria bacterium]|nr:apolipoprotein N-acyltransferase [Thermodesulfobacteriota bacterium]
MIPYFLALFGGLFVALAHPKVSWSYLAFLSLAFLLEAQRQAPQRAARLFFLGAWVYFVFLLYWLVPVMTHFGGLPFPAAAGVLGLLAAYLALYWVLPLYLARGLGFLNPGLSGALGLASLFTLFEFLRAKVPFAFPWGLLGTTQYKETFLIQIADWGGVFAVTFLVVLVNYAVFSFVSARKKAPLLLAVLCLLGAYFYGAWRLGVPLHGVSQKMGLIQGNIPQDLKWEREILQETLAKYQRLSLRAIKKGAEILLWPETAIPTYFSPENPLFRGLFAWVREIQRPLIFGAPRLVREGGKLKIHNSLILVRPDGKVAIYDKQQLVPFGEFVPFEDRLPWLRRFAVASGEYSPGSQRGLLPLRKDQKFGPLICFESIFPSLARGRVRDGATILLVATNDAWFGTTAGPYQHFVQAVFRAVETRRYVVRIANTGISGLIDPFGRIRYKTPLEKEAAPCVEAKHLAYFSWYVRYGDVFVFFCLVLALLLGAKSILGRKRYEKEEA